METKNLNQKVSGDSQMNEMVNLPRPRLSLSQAVGSCMSKYAEFTGRARRSEYWWFSFFYLMVVLVLVCPIGVMAYLEESRGINMDAGLWSAGMAIAGILAVFGALAALAFLIPCIAVEVRRLHDTGRSGWWVLWSFVISAAAIVVPFIFLGSQVMDMGDFEIMKSAFDVALWAGLIVGAFCIANWVLEILLFVFCLLDSDRKENKYGPSPKYQ